MMKPDGIHIVVETVAAMRSLDVKKLRSHFRSAGYPSARHEVCWLCRDLEIGPQKVVGAEVFLQYDTVTWALRRTTQLMQRDPAYAAEVQRLRDMCLRRLRGDVRGIEGVRVNRFEAMNVARRILQTTNPHLHATAPELRGMAAALLGVTETTNEGGQHA